MPRFWISVCQSQRLILRQRYSVGVPVNDVAVVMVMVMVMVTVVGKGAA